MTLKFVAGCQCRSWKDWKVPTSNSAHSSTELPGDLKVSICPGTLTFRLLGKKVLKKNLYTPYSHFALLEALMKQVQSALLSEAPDTARDGTIPLTQDPGLARAVGWISKIPGLRKWRF